MRKLTTEEFIVKAKIVHGDKYDYSKTVYIKSNEKLEINCYKHGSFWQLANDHLSKCGCPKCKSDTLRVLHQNDAEKFISKALIIHLGLYDYSKVVYTTCDMKVEIICKKHGIFWQTPENHIQKQGCPKCHYDSLREYFKSNEIEFARKANIKHNNLYDYSKVQYTKNSEKVEIICKKHGMFRQTPDSHLGGRGCISCTKNHSKVAIEWLEFLASGNDIDIKHALNGGEFKVGKYRMDGYCVTNNTCYEFHGCYWHGCPTCYDPEDRNLVNGKRNRKLYKKTINREKYIKHQGYNLTIIWEHEWKNLIKNYLEKGL